MSRYTNSENGITFSSDCKADFEEVEEYEPKRRARGRGRPRKGSEDEELKSAVRSKPVNYEDLPDEDD